MRLLIGQHLIIGRQLQLRIGLFFSTENFRSFRYAPMA